PPPPPKLLLPFAVAVPPDPNPGMAKGAPNSPVLREYVPLPFACTVPASAARRPAPSPPPNGGANCEVGRPASGSTTSVRFGETREARDAAEKGSPANGLKGPPPGAEASSEPGASRDSRRSRASTLRSNRRHTARTSRGLIDMFPPQSSVICSIKVTSQETEVKRQSAGQGRHRLRRALRAPGDGLTI